MFLLTKMGPTLVSIKMKAELFVFDESLLTFVPTIILGKDIEGLLKGTGICTYLINQYSLPWPFAKSICYQEFSKTASLVTLSLKGQSILFGLNAANANVLAFCPVMIGDHSHYFLLKAVTNACKLIHITYQGSHIITLPIATFELVYPMLKQQKPQARYANTYLCQSC